MGDPDSIEIEKKFRLTEGPARDQLGEGKVIDQAYVLAGDSELRIRNKAGKHTMTVKSSGDMVRREWEEGIPAWVFDALWEQAVGTLRKTRYEHRYEHHVLEIDQYHDELEGLWIVECEFDSESAAEAFELPDWLGEATEVTDDKRFKNKRLATEGLSLTERVSPR